MTGSDRTEVVVIGAGAVGVCCALWLRRQGHEVLLVDSDAIASGASYGNASTLADYGCTPIARPEIWGSMPRLLFSADSPFVVNWLACHASCPGWCDFSVSAIVRVLMLMPKLLRSYSVVHTAIFSHY